jgi:hypothetical protein
MEDESDELMAMSYDTLERLRFELQKNKCENIILFKQLTDSKIETVKLLEVIKRSKRIHDENIKLKDQLDNGVKVIHAKVTV